MYFTFYNTTNSNELIISASDYPEAVFILKTEVTHPELWICQNEEGETLEDLMHL